MSENLSKIDKKTRQAIETRDKLTFNDHDSSGEVYSGYPQCPRVSMPMISIPNQTIEKSINEWLAELLCSSENINILAENSLGVLGKGDDDLRMREMTEEEKSSMETYVLLNSAILSAKNVLYVSLNFIFFHPISIFWFVIVKRRLLSPPPFFFF